MFDGTVTQVVEDCCLMCLVLRDRLALFAPRSSSGALLLVGGFGISWDLSDREPGSGGSDW